MKAPRAIALCQCFNGSLEFQAGHWGRAEETLREAISLYHQIGAASGEALARQQLGVVLTARGELDEALEMLEEGALVAERATMRAHCLARLYATMARNRLAAGDLVAAKHVLYLGLNMSERHGNCTTCDALLLPVAVSVRVAQGQLDEAEAFCRELEESAASYGSQTWVAMARKARGELLEAREEYDRALAALAEATERFREAAFDYEAARCLSLAARVRTRRANPGDEEKAAQARQEAQRIFEELEVAS
jgi:tetratricopeptide (TPR) repeat protein